MFLGLLILWGLAAELLAFYPGMQIRLPTIPVTFTQKQIDAIKDESVIMYIFGEVAYRDVFDHPHCTTFCLRFAPDFSEASVCDTYNEDIDGECPQEKNQ